MIVPGRIPPQLWLTTKWKLSNLSILAVVVSVLVFAFLVYHEDVVSMARATTGIAYAGAPSSLGAGDEGSTDTEDVGGEGCDLFAGGWVYDDVARPSYGEEDCGYLTAQLTCVRNGRKDDMYQKWRWQPDGCNIPRFNARRLLRRLKGKRLLFVGDSVLRNQWESMVCLVQSVIPPDRKSLHKNGSLLVFRAEAHNATVEFFWAPFLVESNSDDPDAHSIRDRTITPDSISTHAVHWLGADYLIFNTYIWWMNRPNMNILEGSRSSNNGSTTFHEVERSLAYARVLRTWGTWVDRNVDPSRTSVFFSTMSPLHINSDDWNNPDGMKCARETHPILNMTKPPYVGTDKRLWTVAADVARAMTVPVSFLNITELSEYRKDAHTSVYTTQQGKLLSLKQRADPLKYADCIHWCLPGVPDTWNELLYAEIMSRPG